MCCHWKHRTHGGCDGRGGEAAKDIADRTRRGRFSHFCGGTLEVLLCVRLTGDVVNETIVIF